MKKQLDIKKLLVLNLPYILMGLFATNFGEGWRMAVGADASAKMLSFFSTLPEALASWWPSLHPLDLLVGLCCGGGLRLAVYLKSKNAKKYRHGMEYGSARWGTHEDIAPYIDPVFQNNVILTKTESLTMNSRPKDPKTARNKNVLVIGGSGSGKTRFWLKPNLMQMHSSYVVTDPKGTILVECGKMLQRGTPKLGKDGKPMKDKHGKVIYEPYRIKVLNTINFKKSMHYNPFAYGGRAYLEKQDYILFKQKEQLAAQEQKLEELTMKIEDVEALVDEVADIAYDKAVEVVADTVKLETHKEDIKLVEQSKAWVLSPERKASKKEVEYAVKRLDGVIARITNAMKSTIQKIQTTLMKPEVKKAGTEQIKKKAKSSIIEQLSRKKKEIAEREVSRTDQAKSKKQDMEL